jgi:hypothetical protein
MNNMSTASDVFGDFIMAKTKDHAIVRVILAILHQQNLTVAEAKSVLQKAERAIELIPFQWDDETKITALL